MIPEQVTANTRKNFLLRFVKLIHDKHNFKAHKFN